MAVSSVPAPERIRLLLVEDDDGDAVLVEALLEDLPDAVALERARTVDEALTRLPEGFDCVLLDLGLPDAQGLGALHAVVGAAAGAAVVCLTGLDAEASGVAAVAAGAQDYLVKGQVDDDRLRRAIRYAIERRRTQEQARQLISRELQAAENRRLERSLLPRPVVRDPALVVTTRYHPGRDGLLAGDFFDVVEADDGTLLAIIGDVTGHGPDAAALGVSLRIAWRTLVLAGTPVDQLLPVLQQVLLQEREVPEVFATACLLVVHPDRRSGSYWLAGHHAPVLMDPRPEQVPVQARGPMLGLFASARWPRLDLTLGERWRLVLFTDGWIEGRVDHGPRRLGIDGWLALMGEADGDVPSVLDAVLERVLELNGGPMSDDVAAVALEWDGGSAPPAVGDRGTAR
ncbi:PP2C family protein-serine/threonine phosphatase [Thalassiella azotivora]